MGGSYTLALMGSWVLDKQRKRKLKRALEQRGFTDDYIEFCEGALEYVTLSERQKGE